MQFQIYSIIQVKRTKVFNVFFQKCKIEKKSQYSRKGYVLKIMYNKIYKCNNLCKNKHIVCEIYGTYAKIFMKIDTKEIEK